MDTSLFERIKAHCLNNKWRQNYGSMESCLMELMEEFGTTCQNPCPSPTNQTNPVVAEPKDYEDELEYLEDLNLTNTIILIMVVVFCAYRNRGNIWRQLTMVFARIMQLQTWVQNTRRRNTQQQTPGNIVRETMLNQTARVDTEPANESEIETTNEPEDETTDNNDTIRPTSSPPPPPASASVSIPIVDEPIYAVPPPVAEQIPPTAEESPITPTSIPNSPNQEDEDEFDSKGK